MTEIPEIRLDLIQTLAVAAVVYYAGVGLKRAVPVLDSLNIPAAVVGGLMFAAANMILRDRFLNLIFETGAQQLFNVAFFTSIGAGASLELLKKGGAGVIVFLLIATIACLVQNFVGMGLAVFLNVHPLFGVLAGSVTLVGGPATGMAFAPLFEAAGIPGASTLAITAATFGIVIGGIAGGPVSTWLISRHNLRSMVPASSPKSVPRGESQSLVIDPDSEHSPFMVNLVILAAAMGLGSLVSMFVQDAGWTLPAYIGAMLVASVIRNIDDRTGAFGIDERTMGFIGGVALNIFLVVALINLRLGELTLVIAPMAFILIAQAIATAMLSIMVCYRVMGRNYESAVITGGFIGFVMGTTANAVANMKALEARYGPAPRAFLIVPLVGAFFIDFVNALVINLFLDWFR